MLEESFWISEGVEHATLFGFFEGVKLVLVRVRVLIFQILNIPRPFCAALENISMVIQDVFDFFSRVQVRFL